MLNELIEKTFSTIQLECEDAALTIWLNRPRAKNAISDEMIEEIQFVLDEVANDRSVRAIVLRGREGIFCAGGDLKWFKSDMQSMPASEVAAANRTIGHLLTKLDRQPQVVIALVEGAAIGGGLGLACTADITIVTADCKFRLSETSLGIPPAQIAPFVTDRVGQMQARRMMLTGAAFDGEEACEVGIAHWAVQGSAAMEQKGSEVLAQIRACAPGAIASTKAIIQLGKNNPREQALDLASDEFAACMLGDEAKEGLMAFAEKRRPKWQS